MASLGDDTANSMASLGLGPGLSAAPGQGLFSTSLGSSLKNVNQSVSTLVRGLREVNSLMTSISKNAAAMRGHFAANGGPSRSLFTNGGLGSGAQQNLGLGSFSTPVAGSGGRPMMPMMSGRRAMTLGFGTAGATAALGALGGMSEALPGLNEAKSLQMNMLPVNLMNGMNSTANAGRVTALTPGMGNMTGAANSLAWMGYNPTQGIGARMLKQSGVMGQMLGMDPAALTGAMGNISPSTANRMKILGVSYFDRNGDPMDASKLANVMYNKLGLNKVKNTEKISRDINQAGYNSYNALNYYITDPAQRELVKKMMILRAGNGGREVNTGDLAKVQSMTGGAMSIAGSEGAYGSQRTQTIAKGNDAASSGAAMAYGAAGRMEEGIRANPLFDEMTKLKVAFEAFSGTGPGQGVVQTASAALKALTTAATAASYALMLKGGGSMAAGAAGLLRGGAAGGAAAAGGMGAGAVAAVAGTAVASGYAALRTGDIYGQYKSRAENPQWSDFKDRDTYLGLLNPVAAGIGSGVGAWNRIKSMVGLGDSGSQSFSGGAAASAGGGSGGGSKGLASKKGATGAALVAFAKRFVGTPYVWGGTTTRGWDCSGFVGYVFRQFGKNLPRTSRQQAGQGKEISFKSAQPGDLLFFGSPVHHVAIYAGNGMMVHAANRKLGTIVSRVWGGLTHTRRVLNTSVGGGTNGVAGSPSTSMKQSDGDSGQSWSPLQGTSLSQGVSGITAVLGSIMDVLGGASGGSGGDQGGGDPGTTDTSTQAAKAGSAGGGPSSGGGSSMVAAIRAAGFTGSLAKTMWAIAMAESSGNTRAHNTNSRTGDNSYGLWQINMLGKMGPERRRLFGISNNDALFDPTTNARAAMKIYQQQGLNAWSTYKHGSHSKYLADAPSFAKGAWSINRDQVANIHAGEMILPASLAHAVRSSLQNGAASGGGGAGVSGNVTIKIYPNSASDAEAVRFGNKLKSVLTGEATLEILRTT